MANFIGLVYATLKDEGIDTKGMSTDEAVAKFKELKGGESESPEDVKKKLNGEKKESKKEEPKKKETSKKEYKEDTSVESNREIDWDRVSENEKINKDKAKNTERKDKYGNLLISDEAFNVGEDAGKKYLKEMLKNYDYSFLKKSNVFLSGMQEVIGNAITNNGYNPDLDLTYQDFNEIIGNVLGEEVNLEEYEQNATKGFTGKAYKGYKPEHKGGYEGVSNIKEAPTFEYKKTGKYTGDKERFNDLYEGFEKKWGERAINEELSNIGFNEDAIENFNSIRKTLKLDSEKSIEVLSTMFNLGSNRKK